MADKLRVLVIDDSAFNRRAITGMLESHPDIEVIASAADGEQGLKLATTHAPDLITLDVEMPRMDGFTFLRLLMTQKPTPVIMVSSHSRKHEVFQALELGALDFIAKPSRFFSGDEEDLRNELVSKALAVRLLQIVPFAHASSAKGASGFSDRPVSRPEKVERSSASEAEVSRPVKRLVCIGSSTGGPPALQKLFSGQSGGGDTAYLVAQHMPENFTHAFAQRLDRRSGLHIKEAESGEEIKAGYCYIAAGGHHMEVVWRDDKYYISQKPRSENDNYVPSADRLLTSASKVAGEKVLAVVLTGMGNDGAEGVVDVHKAGGRVIAESQDSCIVYGMPKEAVATGVVDDVLHLKDIVDRVEAFALGAKF